MQEFDFVIAGAGTAGCAVAYRLAERGYTVCVLEAGPEDRNPLIRIPSGIMKTSSNPRLTWRYEFEASHNTKDRPIPAFFGKTLGGSSAINGMVYNRGQRSDFDGWAAGGAEGWDYRSVLPYFRRSERYLDGGEDEYRGREGLIPVGKLRRRDPLSDRFIASAIATGIPPTDDYNGREQEGVSYVQAQIADGRRWSSAHGYLHPARHKFKVDVRTHALVRRILIEQGRATGVEYSTGDSNGLQTVLARKSTIISAGALVSPKLLQLSGVGPGELLQQIGISVVRDLPGVGANLSDHFSARMVARVKPGLGTINELAKGWPLAVEVANWLLGRPSVLEQTAMSVFTFCKSDPLSPDTDYSLMFLPASLKSGMTRRLDDYPGVSGGAWQQRPESRGFVRIKSLDAREAPVIQPNYLDAEIDRQVTVRAMKHLDRIFKTDPLASVIEGLTFPAGGCSTDDEWLDFVRGNGMGSYHPAGTCRMGAVDDPTAVVDHRLRVLGVGNLRVVDASVFPTQPSGNLNASVMMTAEKAADMILEDFTERG
jgi:choline dehydrogenase